MVRAMRQVMDQADADVAFEHRVMKQNGSVQWLVWTGEIIRDREGNALHILGTVRATAGGAGSVNREAYLVEDKSVWLMARNRS